MIIDVIMKEFLCYCRDISRDISNLNLYKLDLRYLLNYD